MPTDDEKPDPAAEARALLHAARHGALSTLAPDGSPFVSLVAVATAEAGIPLFLLSRLARHTQHLMADPRAALLVATASGHPMAAARLSVAGRMERTEGDDLLGHFLAAHPDARAYAGFSDFALWRLQIEGAHLVAGFGRIHDLPAAALAPPGSFTPADLAVG